MNAAEFNKAMAERLGITQAEATSRIESLVQVLKETFDKNTGISLLKFGNFSLKKTEPRRGYSPVLKRYVIFPPKKVLEFHPSDVLREKIKYTGIE